jgi:hypothetical protein
MAHKPSTADQLHDRAERIHDIVDRLGRSQSARSQ